MGCAASSSGPNFSTSIVERVQEESSENNVAYLKQTLFSRFM